MIRSCDDALKRGDLEMFVRTLPEAVSNQMKIRVLREGSAEFVLALGQHCAKNESIIAQEAFVMQALLFEHYGGLDLLAQCALVPASAQYFHVVQNPAQLAWLWRHVSVEYDRITMWLRSWQRQSWEMSLAWWKYYQRESPVVAEWRQVRLEALLPEVWELVEAYVF